MKSRTIDVDYLARVEGEGAIHVKVKGNKVTDVQLKIFEPPRFFEAFLRGRNFTEAPDITARICGICPIAYQMSAVHAMEDALGVKVEGQLRALRRLIYCGEWIESHALHVYMLHAPDFLGYPDAIQMAKDYPKEVQRALELKKIGNELLKAIGGRSVHPVNACVGGWYRWPDAAPLKALLPELEWGLEFAKETVRWSLTLPYPDLEIDYEFVAIHHPDEYGIMLGDIWSSKGSKISIKDFETHYIEEQVQHSNALHGHTVDGSTYLVGPLARLNLNHEQLMPNAKRVLKDAKLKLPLKNPYKSLIARAIELVHFYEEAIALVKTYNPSGPAHTGIKLMAGEGAGASEAPRGLLYHRYKIDENGLIRFVKITPPTAQNLPRIEADLLALVPKLVKMEQERATLTAEQLVRAYDPCISCATHFLKLKIEEINHS